MLAPWRKNQSLMVEDIFLSVGNYCNPDNPKSSKYLVSTLLGTNISPENPWLEDVLLGPGLFSGAMSHLANGP